MYLQKCRVDSYFKTKHLPYSGFKIILILNFDLYGREGILVIFYMREEPKSMQIGQS